MDGGRNGLTDENLVLIAYVNNDGWGEHVRAFSQETSLYAYTKHEIG